MRVAAELKWTTILPPSERAANENQKEQRMALFKYEYLTAAFDLVPNSKAAINEQMVSMSHL